MYPGFLAEENASLAEAWQDYSSKLTMAKNFHKKLGAYYHPNTYAHCGDDSKHKSWFRVSWALSPLHDMVTGLWARPPSEEVVRDRAKLVQDYAVGTCEILNPESAGPVFLNRNGVGVTENYSGDAYRATLSSQDDPGDGTVPAHSGEAPTPSSNLFARMTGFQHQDSYKDNRVRALTLYSIIRIAAQAKPLV